MEKAFDIRKTIEYQQGYYEGYIEGLAKGTEQLVDFVKNQSKPRSIIISCETVKKEKRGVKIG